MKSRIRIGLAAAVAAAVVTAFAGPAGASTWHNQFDSHSQSGGYGQSNGNGQFGSHDEFDGNDHVVFVQTDNLSGNQIVTYDRSWNGTLTQANTYSTGGLGGQLTGSVVDHLASEGSLVYDAGSNDLYAVNAGSNTVSVFSVHGDRLFLKQVINSGGTFPVSVAVNDNLVYVVNALNGGAVQGFLNLYGYLLPLPGANQPLNLNASATPQFVNTPGQVAFSPDGRQLIVTTKANGNDIDVFHIGFFGSLSTPVVNAEGATVPFGISFDQGGHLVIAEAGTNALATFSLSWNGTVMPITSVATNQAATCWVVPVGNYFYASNAGSNSVSGFQSSFHGQLNAIGTTATDAGTVDAAAVGQYLYVQTGGSGIVDGFRVAGDGSLSAIGSVTVPNAIGGEGIVAL